MKRRRAALITAAATAAIAAAGGATWYLSQPRKDKPNPKKRYLACIGDSITFGAGVMLARKQQAWPYLLEKLLGVDCQVLNYGISGATASDEGDKPYRSTDFLDTALSVHADTYLFMLGTNDSKPYNWNPEQYEKAVCEILDELKATGARVIVMLPPKAFPNKRGKIAFDIDDSVIREQVLPILNRVAEDRNLSVIDLYTFTESHPDYFVDGVHPNAGGNRKIASYVFTRLRDLWDDSAIF
ncbi:MAG: hypothetical protein IJ091_00300 [Oscillospiraceae bacterium]|nr:hypothetical protein [Oscillospiraceae bacterium]